MKKLLLTVALSALACGAATAQDSPDQPPIMLDADVWVTFYDLPSRRFRSIRDAFIRRDFESVSRDLEVTIGFLSVEADRAIDQLMPALTDVVTQLEAMRSRLSDTSLSVSQVDALFARAHWLLSQHYLVLAIKAKDLGLHRNVALYLIATAHHLERAVLWSNARISKDVVNSLDAIRKMSGKLRSSQSPERVYRDRPLRLTARALTEIGKQLDRTVRIEALMPE